MSNEKRVIILGATSAIAQATAQMFAKDNCNFILVGRSELRLEAVASDLKVRGASKVEIVCGEISDSSKVHDLFSKINLNNSADEILLLAYGSLGNQEISQNDIKIAHKELETNFVSATLWLSLFANYFEKKRSGTIAVISSVAGDRGRKKNYFYGAAKAGLTTFLSGLRNRLASSSVSVITIVPGFVDTPMTADFKKGALFASPHKVGKDIYNAIYSQVDVIYTPWIWRYIMFLIRNIPERLFKRMNI